jgi:transcriptional regulator with XRE-family HTH domain
VKRRPRSQTLSYSTLADYLARSGDTQAAIARRVGSSQAYISRIARGQAVPRALLAARLADYAHIPLDSFQRVYIATQGGRRAIA